MSLPSVSVIVTTYNWHQALDRVISALCAQNYSNYEIIIADDGSTDTTAEIVREWQTKTPIKIVHCWQVDDGFRAAMIRNRAVALAKNDFIIFLDGDCIPLPNFIRSHAKLAEQGWFIAGNRVLLNQEWTQEVLSKKMPVHHFSIFQWIMGRLKGQCNRLPLKCALPLGPFRKLSSHVWQGAKTCNLGLWRQDFIKINGLDEAFEGWGFEDSDLVVRLQRAQVLRKSGKWAATVIHLWHPTNERNSVQDNAQRLQQTLQSNKIKAMEGIDQYLSHGQYQDPTLE